MLHIFSNLLFFLKEKDIAKAKSLSKGKEKLSSAGKGKENSCLIVCFFKTFYIFLSYCEKFGHCLIAFMSIVFEYLHNLALFHVNFYSKFRNTCMVLLVKLVSICYISTLGRVKVLLQCYVG